MTVTASDLGTYLQSTVDEERATMMVELAKQLCQSICNPLPSAADVVVLDVAARAYSNVTNAQSQGVGPFSASYGPVGGGMWLTRQNKATLRRLNGGGGAFTIDTMPATAGQGLPGWEINTWGFSDLGPAGWDAAP